MTWHPLLDDGDLSSSTPATLSGAAGAAGSATTVSRSDHRHAFTPTTDLGMGGFKLTGLGTPSSGSDAATMAYVDSVAQGLDVKASVRVATTANGTFSTAFANGQTVDGVVLVTGNRILLKNQTLGEQSGIYVVQASGAPVRSADADSDAEVTSGMSVYVEEGTVNGSSQWVLVTPDPIVVDTTIQQFQQFSGAGQITAGDGLSKTGNTLDVNVDGSSIETNADALRVKAAGITNAMLAGSIALSKLATDPLARANHTGSQTAATISDFATAAQAVAVGGDLSGTVVNAQIAAGAIVNADINASAAIALSKLATDPLARANHTGTQLASTVSNFDTQVRTSRLDQMAAPTASVNFSNASATINGLKPVSYTTAGRPTEQTGRIIYDSTIGRLVVSR